MEVYYVVLHESNQNKSITVLDVYTDEEKASSRVGWERELTDENAWYQPSDIIKS